MNYELRTNKNKPNQTQTKDGRLIPQEPAALCILNFDF